MTYLKQSITIVNSYALYILLLAFCGIGIRVSWSGVDNLTQTNVVFIQFILYSIISFFFYLIIYGHLVEMIAKYPKKSWKNLLKTYGVKYLVLLIILMIIYILNFCQF